MMAWAAGKEYVAYETMEKARADPHAYMVMEADSGGQILLTCPVSRVSATEEALAVLLADLESITWGRGIKATKSSPVDARIIYERHAVRGRIPGPMGDNAQVSDGVWLHRELEELHLQHQIEAVLAGEKGRLDLPEGWPYAEVDSLDDLRWFPRGHVLLYCGERDVTLLRAPVALVSAGMPALQQLLRDLEGMLRKPIRSTKGLPSHPKPSRVILLPMASVYPRQEAELLLFSPLEERSLRQPILDVLAGKSERELA